MQRLIAFALAGLGLLTASGAASAAAPADWSKVPATEIAVFYPGISPMEWILGELRVDRVRHGGGRAFRQGDACTDCHAEETVQMGSTIASGEKLEPAPQAGRPGAIPVRVQAVHDGAQLYLRFSWKQPAGGSGPQLDAANPVKIAFMFDADKVDMADRAGCWASCHSDSRTMPDGSEERTKYVKDGDLAGGVFLDLAQWRSGEDRTYGGYVADRRVLAADPELKASGKLDGDTWSVVFSRKLAGGEGSIALEPGKHYGFGFAIHHDHSAGRYHHVSLGYRLGIDVDADITARKQ
jgi:hypothetical protein